MSRAQEHEVEEDRATHVVQGAADGRHALGFEAQLPKDADPGKDGQQNDHQRRVLDFDVVLRSECCFIDAFKMVLKHLYKTFNVSVSIQ